MMVSSMLGVISKNLLCANNLHSSLFTVVRHSSKKPKPKLPRGTIKHRNLIESSCESLSARGFLRSYKPYTPPENVKETIVGICNKIFGGAADQEAPLSKKDKFALLNSCYEELNYSVPNSWIHKLESISDIIEFYQTPVKTTTPYDDLLNTELPPNLYLQPDYIRFSPDSDNIFKGISAFPRSSSTVTGLKYKEKYSSHKSKTPYEETEVNYDYRDQFKL